MSAASNFLLLFLVSIGPGGPCGPYGPLGPRAPSAPNTLVAGYTIASAAVIATLTKFNTI
jgi:hypothetical protein